MDRKEAILLGLTKYSTGKPCKAGHTSERYVQSGACQECINGPGKGGRTVNADRIRQEDERLEIQRRKLAVKEQEAATKALRATLKVHTNYEMTDFYFSTPNGKLETVRNLVLVAAQSVYPDATENDVRHKKLIRFNGSEFTVYQFRVPPQAHPFLREMEATLRDEWCDERGKPRVDRSRFI